ncbi:hypothetical protein BCR34DRAFT_596628 [Clohesyomyces aquaticus]|uniref:Uncharacterized protein n=1 Tax=Clohesyomyces aquaticus TaxID=1231657 RepID=A0A1Y2A5I5_9PLEO|nr:hypothetical protein BCR34DRAFT_596628 [Clohesyomyces aquaticus]
MKTAAISTVLSLLALTSASPTRRTPGNVTICTEANYAGTCETISVPFNDCQQLAAPYFKNVGSFKVDAGAYCRITYTADTCTMHGDSFIFPDTNAPDLRHWDDPATGTIIDAGAGFTSFKCQMCTNCQDKKV